MKTVIFHMCEGTVDAAATLRKVRRVFTRKLNERKELMESTTGTSPGAFEDIQHFYNAMTFAIMALEEAYSSTSMRK